MSFETPMALWAILATTIPVLIHLSKGKRLPTLRLPTVALLGRAMESQGRKRQLSDLFLLLARILLVAAAVLGIAAPSIRVPGEPSKNARRALGIVLDDSFSMGQRADGKSVFEVAQARALELIDDLPKGSEILIVRGSVKPRVVLSRTTNLAMARTAIRALEQTSLGTSLQEAAELARQRLARSSHNKKSCVVLTDGSAPTNLSQDARSDGVRFLVVTLGQGPNSNLAIRSIDVQPAPDSESTLQLHIEAIAFGYDRAPTVTAALAHPEFGTRNAVLVEGDGVYRGTVTVPPVRNPEVMGQLTLELEDAADHLAEDNNWPVHLVSQDVTRLLLVDGKPDANFERSELGYLARALNHAPPTPRPVMYRSTRPERLAEVELRSIDVVVLANVASISKASWRRLSQFVESGGGLLISGGSRLSPQNYRAFASSMLPAAIRGFAPARSPLMVSVSDPSLIDPTTAGLSETRVHSRLLLDRPTHGSSIVLNLSDGSPLLLWKPVGAGRVALMGTSLNQRWTNLPLQAGFLPLLVRLLNHLAQPDRDDVTVGLAGDAIALPEAAHSVQTPAGQVVAVPDSGSPFRGTDQAGVYRFRDSEARVVGFALLRPALEESNLQRVHQAALTRQSQRSGSRESDTSPAAPAAVESRSFTREPVGPWLLLAFGLLLALEAAVRSEQFVVRSNRQKRNHEAPSYL